MDREHWFDTLVPCSVLHVPLAAPKVVPQGKKPPPKK